MNEEYERAYQALTDLIEATQKRDMNEAQTRFEIIDQILVNCLGWKRHKEINVEEHTESGFADYVVRTSRNVFVIEAKRTKINFELPISKEPMSVSISTLTKNDGPVLSAINQVRVYAQEMGIPIAVISNGIQYVAFIASRSDGQAPMKGKAIAFTSLEQIKLHFEKFWNYFSPEGIVEGTLQRTLLNDEIQESPLKPSSTIQDYPGIYARNSIQNEMRLLSELILEDINNEDIEKEFLKYCYCESGALSKYSALAKDAIKNRYEQIEDSTQVKIERIRTKKGINTDFIDSSKSKRPVILMGDVGVGKTTFIRNLIISENSILQRNDIALHINLGENAILSSDVKTGAITKIKDLLLDEYEIDINEDEFVREVYKDNLDRFKKGIYKSLDESQFKLKEIEELEKLLSDEAEHIKKTINYLVNGRKLKTPPRVIIFLDNADQRTSQDQQQIFLIAHELSAQTAANLFVSIRPETFYLSHKEGVLAAYHPKVYSIEPPRIDMVLIKRIEFALKVSSGEITVPRLAGQTIKLENLTTLLRVMLRTFKSEFDEQKRLMTTIDNIAAGNVRRAVDMVKNFLSSGHTNTVKILEIEEKEPDQYHIPMHEFMKSIINGEHRYYDPDSSIISNVFSVKSMDPKEYLLNLITLLKLINLSSTELSVQGFIPAEEIYNRLQAIGFLPEQIDKSLAFLIKDELIENPLNSLLNDNELALNSIRTTPKGAIYVKLLAGTFQYVDAMLVDTPIIDKALYSELVESYSKTDLNIEDRLQRCENFMTYVDTVFKTQLEKQNDNEINNFYHGFIANFRSSIQRARLSYMKTQQKLAQK